MSATRRSLVLFAGLVVLDATGADAYVAGGGPARTDCFAAWQVTSPDDTANRGPTGVDCQDGDPACDVDGVADGICSFGVSFCAGGEATVACTPVGVESVKLSRRATAAGVTAPTVGCGSAAVVPLAIRTGPRGTRPSRTLVLSATAVTASGRDRDVVRLRCVPNRGAGRCPANAAGGPREVALVVGASGTDLDNGSSGVSHNFPVPSGATLRMCVSGCDLATNPSCVQDEAATDAVQADTFGPPLPLLAAGVPTCIVNRFAPPGLTGGTADLASGATAGALHLLSDVFLSDQSQVCPVCSGRAVGATGTCSSGRNAGRACRTDALMDVLVNGDTRRLAVSADCTPSGAPAGTLSLTLPLTTGTSAITASACGAPPAGSCGAGTCDATCTGSACVATTPDGACVDAKGGVSQTCCSNDTQRSCFPNGADGIVRTGAASTPLPAWPDAGYPKSAPATLVATFCEGATGSTVVDIVTGLPGPGALILPVTQTFLP